MDPPSELSKGREGSPPKENLEALSNERAIVSTKEIPEISLLEFQQGILERIRAGGHREYLYAAMAAVLSSLRLVFLADSLLVFDGLVFGVLSIALFDDHFPDAMEDTPRVWVPFCFAVGGLDLFALMTGLGPLAAQGLVLLSLFTFGWLFRRTRRTRVSRGNPTQSLLRAPRAWIFGGILLAFSVWNLFPVAAWLQGLLVSLGLGPKLAEGLLGLSLRFGLFSAGVFFLQAQVVLDQIESEVLGLAEDSKPLPALSPKEDRQSS